MSAAAALCLLVLVLAGCATTNLAPVTTGSFAMEEDEQRLWARVEKEQAALEKSGIIYSNEEIERYLNEIARRLQPPDVVKAIPFTVKVINNYHLNAFAFPNGALYIHTGILARMENEAQLATLLAHEMTHATHRHTVKAFRDIKNKTAFLAAFQVTFGGFGGLAAIGTLAAVTGYSRELETEADMEGLQAMVRAGYDPTEAPKLFIHLKQEIEEEEIKEPFFFGSHPRLKERIENYETFLQEYGRKTGVKNAEIFFAKTGGVILDNALLDLKAGRFKSAQRGIERYLAVRPNDAKAHYLLGEVFRQRGEKDDAEKARACYAKAISADPTYSDPYKGLGLVHYKSGERALAQKHLKSYLALAPAAPDRAYIEEYIRQCEGGDRK